MPMGRTKREIDERRMKIVEFKWKVLPLLTKEWKHSSNLIDLVDTSLSKDITRKWVYFALKKLENEGKVESMRDSNFSGLYWRLK